mmetsp:Transcript_115186/g.332727  ORF Transcript_115186/g.332727 Transcript_115186/m.332727 type:complete len:213 (-) Transcript_115186:86-724(-)
MVISVLGAACQEPTAVGEHPDELMPPVRPQRQHVQLLAGGGVPNHRSLVGAKRDQPVAVREHLHVSQKSAAMLAVLERLQYSAGVCVPHGGRAVRKRRHPALSAWKEPDVLDRDAGGVLHLRPRFLHRPPNRRRVPARRPRQPQRPGCHVEHVLHEVRRQGSGIDAQRPQPPRATNEGPPSRPAAGNRRTHPCRLRDVRGGGVDPPTGGRSR